MDRPSMPASMSIFATARPAACATARFHAASRGAVPPALEIGFLRQAQELRPGLPLRLGPPGLIDREVANASKSPGLGTLATKPSRNPEYKRGTAVGADA